MERERELALIGERIGPALRGAGAVVAIEGQPGLGKTTLVAATAATAADAGMRVLRACGAELEHDLGWGIVRSLLGGYVANGRRPFQGATRAALPLFAGEPKRQRSSSAGPILHGLYWLISDLAGERPLAIVVDDVQWADAPSARWLAHLSARVADLPVLIVLAARPAPASPSWQAIASRPGSSLLTLSPLSAAGTRALVADRVGPGHDDLADACQEATGGNPFLVSELLRHVKAFEGAWPTAAEVRTLRPESIRRAVLLRLAQLGPDAAQLANAIAVLGQRATVGLAGELAALPRDAATRAADALAAANVIRIGSSLSFVHPLLLEVVREQIPDAQGSESHRRAAELLGARGAKASELAPHLLATEPDGRATVVEVLRSAAGEALAVGAPEVAATCLRRALSEPPPEPELTGVLAELGRVEGLLHEPGSIPRLREALSRAGDPVMRAGIARELATQLVFRGEVGEGVSLCSAAALDLPADERELKHALLAQACTANGQDLRAPDQLALEIDAAELTGESPGERLLLAAVSNARAGISQTPLSDLCAMASRALGGTTLLSEVSADSPQFWNATCVLMYGEHYEDVDRLINAALDDSRRRGSSRGFGFCVCFRSPLEYRLGRLPDAAEDARRAVETFADEPLIRSFALTFLIDSLIDQGALDEAHTALAGVDLHSLPPTVACTMLRGGSARLRRAMGETAQAADEMLVVSRQFGSSSSPFWPWRAEAALAAHAGGDPELARSLAAEEVRRARGIGSRWAQARALYALAIVEGSLEPLERAEVLTRGWPTRLERARVLAELGAGRRRRGRAVDAEPVLREALELADACGAVPIAERAREELRIATGARPRRAVRSGPESLTPSELRVCRMAADGVGNRQIAQALFVSLRTVETHLTHSYEKLGIAGREELARALGFVGGA